MAELINATEARNNFNELVNRVRYGKERLIITHHNQEAAVLISREDLELLERLEDTLLGEQALVILEQAKADGDSGLSLSELKKDLNL
jgi:prevent-host-death family protein